MKRTFYILLLLSFSTTGFSQLDNIYKNKSLAPKQKPVIKYNFNKETAPPARIIVEKNKQNNMPVLKFELAGTYKGNNGKGSDIYAYTPDNMPCLKPDSTFYSNMPVGALVKQR